jgi:arylsulfatase A-like enzyme
MIDIRAISDSIFSTSGFKNVPSPGSTFTVKIAQATSALALSALTASAAFAQTADGAADKPNILIIYPDDVGWSNVSAYGQFGKNHLGDDNFALPTTHGFDEFFGNLYHLNAEETPEDRTYPQDPEFKAKYGPRGVLHSWATDVDDATVDPRFGVVGKQKIEDTGPLNIERMKTVDDEFMDAGVDFVKRAHEADKPWFVWLNPSRMHLYQHLRDENRYLAQEATMADDVYGSGMMEHDMQVGQFLDRLRELGELDNTIIIYSTDNGPEHVGRVHGGTTPFRGEKLTTYEGGVRVPFIVSWPGHIPAGQVKQGIQANMDVFTTLAAAAGVEDVAADILKEKNQVIDGVNNLAWWQGTADKSNRDDFIYYEGTDIRAVRLGKWKMHFATSEGMLLPWHEQKFPLVMNLHFDPYESFDSETDVTYGNERKQWLMGPVQDLMAEHVASLIKHPPLQLDPGFDLSKIIEKVKPAAD